MRESLRTKIRAELLSDGEQLALTPLGMAVPTGQRARRRRPQSVQSSLHSSCTSSSCSSLSWFRRLLHFSWYMAFSRYWQYGRIVATRYGSVDATTATQLLINTTWFSFPRDIGTPRHRNPESKHRDIGNLGTLEPRVHREGKGHRPESRERAPTRGTVFFFQVPPWRSLAVSPLRVSLPSRSWRLRRPGWCTLVAGTVFGLSFPETLKGRCGPTATVDLSGRRLLNESWRAVLSPALSKKTDGGGRVREERLLTNGGGGTRKATPVTDGGGRVTVALQRREGSAALPSGDAREGSDTPGRREPKECERGRAEVLGTFCVRLRASRP